MSHKLFSGSILSNARVWALLKRIDAAEAERSRSTGCPRRTPRGDAVQRENIPVPVAAFSRIVPIGKVLPVIPPAAVHAPYTEAFCE